jgi:hypothetical protein
MDILENDDAGVAPYSSGICPQRQECRFPPQKPFASDFRNCGHRLGVFTVLQVFGSCFGLKSRPVYPFARVTAWQLKDATSSCICAYIGSSIAGKHVAPAPGLLASRTHIPGHPRLWESKMSLHPIESIWGKHIAPPFSHGIGLITFFWGVLT